VGSGGGPVGGGKAGTVAGGLDRGGGLHARPSNGFHRASFSFSWRGNMRVV